MKNQSKIQQWPQGENTSEPDQSSQISNASLHYDYANEGDEYLDDAIRTVDQDFGQIDGTYEAWRMRSARGLNK